MVKYLRQNQNYTFTRMSNEIFLTNTFWMTLVLVYNRVALTGPKLNLMSSHSRSFNRLFGHKHPSRKVSTNAYYATHLPVFQPYNFTQFCSFIVALDIRREFFGLWSAWSPCCQGLVTGHLPRSLWLYLHDYTMFKQPCPLTVTSTERSVLKPNLLAL